MSKNKPTPGGRAKKNSAVSLLRSSAAEYLTFVAASGQSGVEAVYADENVWLTQKMMGLLYYVETHTINYHLKRVFADSELLEDSVIRNFRITAADGKTYDTHHYNLAAIIAVGYKVNSERAVQFRKWAATIIEGFTIKGYAMDDERLKNGGSILTNQYFEEQLQRVREVRLSERKFYQKITDIYATSIDYDVTAMSTQRFFATVQNTARRGSAIRRAKPYRRARRRRDNMHWAAHGQTEAEMIHSRVNAGQPFMGLKTTRPGGIIRKEDASIAKNYLDAEEIDTLNRIVTAYIEFAELRALQRRVMTVRDWIGNPDNPIVCRHIHSVSYNPAENAFYACTGDIDRKIGVGLECHWLRGLYDSAADKWAWKVVVSSDANSRFKSGGINFVDGQVYWVADANGPKTLRETYDRGIFRCAPADIADKSKHTRLYPAEYEIAAMTIDGQVIVVPEYGNANPCDCGFLFSPDLGKTWGKYDLKEFGDLSGVRVSPRNAEGWFRVDLRARWLDRSKVLFLKPKGT
jgi:hypothetical protein